MILTDVLLSAKEEPLASIVSVQTRLAFLKLSHWTK